jgi:hypothetical protein
VAGIPRVAVELGRRGVAGRLPSRPCPEPRDGADSRLRPAELRIHWRDLLIAAVRPWNAMSSYPEGYTYMCGGEMDAGEFYISITSDDLDPVRVAEQVGIAPTRSHRRGDPLARTGRTYSYGEWCLSTGRLDFQSGPSCEQQFDDFIRRLPSDETLWQRIQAQHSVRVSIVLWMETWNREINLSPFALGELSRFRLALNIDTYLASDDEEEAKE